MSTPQKPSTAAPAPSAQLALPHVRLAPARARRRGPKRKKFARVPHRGRAVHKGRHPVHVTLRARQGLPSFRQQLVHALVLRVLANQRRRAYGTSFQIVHFSIQSNHLHMIVEADDGPTASVESRKRNALRSGISGFVIAFARRLNRLLGRRGRVWDDRYHRHDLGSPHEVKRSLRYVLSNARKHGQLFTIRGGFDPFSSAQHFDGWSEPLIGYLEEPVPFTPAAARTWLLTRGWRRHGLIDPLDTPGPLPRH
jgi:REP element-mobilizing transposase RayT